MTTHRLRRAAAAAVVVAALGGGALAACGRDGEEARDGDRAARVPGRDAPVAAQPSFRLTGVARGLVRPTGVAAAPGDPRALWVTEQTGRLVRIAGGRRTTVLDLRDEVSVGGERGLLGLAFHPDFARNRRLFVDYTNRAGDTRVVEYRLGRDGRARPDGARTLLAVPQPEENHNGGALAFALDGRLLVGMGDGGGAFDRGDRAQDPRQRLGKVLAADVDAPGDVRWEVLLTGLRNPWRIWVDPALNELWIGDVGQDATEEVDRVLYEPDEPPKNLGWPAWEGDRLLDAGRLAEGARAVAPVAVYGHDEGCSVTGGLIYRGAALDALRERYVYADFCTGTVWSLRPRPALAVADVRREAVRIPQVTALAADARGELVVTTAAGELLRAVAPR
ncbi:MAG TPA: PQQ-dependent sugar dehydrogenase [Solirubrobacteraceae bacterium]